MSKRISIMGGQTVSRQLFPVDVEWLDNQILDPDKVTNIKCMLLGHFVEYSTNNYDFLSIYCTRCRLGAYVGNPKFKKTGDYRTVDITFYDKQMKYIREPVFSAS
jgi:hypothetical protein